MQFVEKTYCSKRGLEQRPSDQNTPGSLLLRFGRAFCFGTSEVRGFARRRAARIRTASTGEPEKGSWGGKLIFFELMVLYGYRYRISISGVIGRCEMKTTPKLPDRHTYGRSFKPDQIRGVDVVDPRRRDFSIQVQFSHHATWRPSAARRPNAVSATRMHRVALGHREP